jgi:hypothetical protein
MLEELLQEVPNSKCKLFLSGFINSLGCLTSIAVYKVALARLNNADVRNEVIEIVNKLEQDDPMRRGRYQDWRIAIQK